jgi:LmbE family N-acetylglucosaminyl deacetylase
MNELQPLEPVTEDWQKALAVVAHPDDLEFGTSAAIARWTRQGKQVVYCLLTSGEAGIDGVDPAECGPLREAEQIESSRIVGVSAVEFLGQPDGTIEYGVALRRVITAAIRRHQPEIVITNNFRDTWDGDVLLNQADHINTGRATLDAVRDAANRWIFPDAATSGPVSARFGRPGRRTRGTGWTPPTRSSSASSRSRRTRPTSTG